MKTLLVATTVTFICSMWAHSAAAIDCRGFEFDSNWSVTTDDRGRVTEAGGRSYRARITGDLGEAERAARDIVDCNQLQLGASAAELEVLNAKEERFSPDSPTGARIRFQQLERGYPVLGAQLEVRFVQGAFINVQSRLIDSARLDPRQPLSQTQIANLARSWLGMAATDELASATLGVDPESGKLVWVLDFKLFQSRLWRLWLDAHDGSVLSQRDLVKAEVSGVVHGPNSNDQVITFPNQRVFLVRHDPSGQVLAKPQFTTVDGGFSATPWNVTKGGEWFSLEAGLNGHFAHVTSESRDEPYGTPNAWFEQYVGTQDFVYLDWLEHDPSANLEQSKAYGYIDGAHTFFTKGGVFNVHELDYAMPVRTDSPQVNHVALKCGGVFEGLETGIRTTGVSTRFYDEITGEVASCPPAAANQPLMVHEYTHAVQVVESAGTPALPNGVDVTEVCAVEEGIADYFGASVTGTGVAAEEPPLFSQFLTGDLKDNGCHTNSKILADTLWEFRQTQGVGSGVADAVTLQAMRCLYWSTPKYTGSLELDQVRLSRFVPFVRCMLAEDSLLYGNPAASNYGKIEAAPHMEAICEAANNHQIAPKECIGHTKAPMVSISSPTTSSPYNPYPVPPEWSSLDVWTNAKFPGHKLPVTITVGDCKDGPVESWSLQVAKIGTWIWSEIASGSSQVVEEKITTSFNFELVEDGAYKLGLIATCATDDGPVQSGDQWETIVIRDQHYYEVNIKQPTTLTHSLTITDPDSDGAITLNKPSSRLNCDGHSLIGGNLYDDDGTAVVVIKNQNGGVENCNIKGYSGGIRVHSSHKADVTWNSISNVHVNEDPLWGAERVGRGIDVSATIANVADNHVTLQTSTKPGSSRGINIDSVSKSALVTRNTISDGPLSAGLVVSGPGYQYTVSDNTISDVTSALVIEQTLGTDIAVLENTLFDTSRGGVSVGTGMTEGGRLRFQNNELFDMSPVTTSTAIQINHHGGATVEVEHNDFDNVEDTKIFKGYGTVFASNTLTDSGKIRVQGGYGVLLQENQLLNTDGVVLEGIYENDGNGGTEYKPPTLVAIHENEVINALGTCISGSADGVLIVDNTLALCSFYGIALGGVDKPLLAPFVSENTITNAGAVGIDISSALSPIVEHNTVHDGTFGIRLMSADQVRIGHNTIVRPSDSGISLLAGSGGKIRGNEIFGKSRVGMLTKNGIVTSGQQLTIADNSFEAQIPAKDDSDGSNVWFVTDSTDPYFGGGNVLAGHEVGGNAYSDYTGTGIPGEFGTTPYTISGSAGEVDELPLVQ